MPGPIAFSLGPLTIFWYGVCYALGLVAVWLVMSTEARRHGLDLGTLANGMIIVAIAALIGGRLYHVIDQWQLYAGNPMSIVLPPYSGLGAPGGLLLGTLAGVLYARYKRQSVALWADVGALGILAMQAVARWGNFFNQELYGPPTNLPWGIAIDCAHRTPEYPCSAAELLTGSTTHFHPLFLYESVSGIIGLIVLIWIARRFPSKLIPGDIALLVFTWYAATRFFLEPLRSNNWTFFGVPTASILMAAIMAACIGLIVVRHARRRDGAGEVAMEPDGDGGTAATAEEPAEDAVPKAGEQADVPVPIPDDAADAMPAADDVADRMPASAP